ncbi:MAG: C-type lectin domain-containing protein, partial [Deltaproteobacteria bacterium]|nr:C-type lectin domain-containing protein [Deltaproteobacteria bacterium]
GEGEGEPPPAAWEHWGRNEPSDSGTGEDCLTIIVAAEHFGNLRGDWNDDQCDSTHPFVCEVPGPAPDPACTTAPVGNRLLAACTRDVDYASARNFCAVYSGTLARIDSPADNDELVDLLVEVMPGGINQVWLGATDEGDEGVFRWADGARVPSPFSLWGLDQPNDLAPGEDCLAISLQSINGVEPGEWVDRSCDNEPKPFVCDAPEQGGPAGSGCTEVTVGGRRRFVCTVTATYPAAEAHCVDESGHLARIDSAAENQELLGALTGLGAISVWLGGSDGDQEGVWRWPDGTIFEELP